MTFKGLFTPDAGRCVVLRYRTALRGMWRRFGRNVPQYAAVCRNIPQHTHTLTYVYKTQDNAGQRAVPHGTATHRNVPHPA